VTNAKVVQLAERAANLPSDGGSNPTPSLQSLCNFCNNIFPSRAALKRHKRIDHTDRIHKVTLPTRQNKQEWKELLHPSMWHPAADLMPMCDGEDFDRLVSDIRENGLQVPVVLFGDKVLDGRNRLKACDVANVAPTFISLDSDTAFDPVSWVLSTNLSRRHLTKSQVACILVDAGELITKLRAEAKARQGTRSDIVEVVPPSDAGKTRDKLGAIGGVSGRYVGMASALKDKAPTTFEWVKKGKESLSKVIRQTAWEGGQIHGIPVYVTQNEKEWKADKDVSFDRFHSRLCRLVYDSSASAKEFGQSDFIQQVQDVLKAPIQNHTDYHRAQASVERLRQAAKEFTEYANTLEKRLAKCLAAVKSDTKLAARSVNDKQTATVVARQILKGPNPKEIKNAEGVLYWWSKHKVRVKSTELIRGTDNHARREKLWISISNLVWKHGWEGNQCHREGRREAWIFKWVDPKTKGRKRDSYPMTDNVAQDGIGNGTQ
jgi:hypothetical protein